ncbi:MBL fold metallo-hydrolase [candidate division KSB1 bacterium]|nr:MBL fold metallo-hydrolase [candidate division KSB1 bacterium]RQW00897.1 MAG: MBL fold metallo-hydrolase [candidate division KSB1 bacterium]
MKFDQNKVIPIRLGSAYCYYLPSPNGSVLIDSGHFNKQNHLQSVLVAHEQDIRDIRYIFVTHTHHDHVGSLAAIKRISDAKVFVHRDEAMFLRQGRTPLPKGTLLWTKMMVHLGTVARIGRYPAVEPDFVISEELQLNEFDYRIQIISTPGHTAGSLTIIVDDHMAFVGDTMFNIRHETVYPPFANDQAALLSSWNRLLGTSCQTFFPGHGRSIDRAKFEHSYHKALDKLKVRGARC